MAEERKVIVYYLETNFDKRSKRIGNSSEPMPVSEAIRLIERDEAIAEGFSRGVVPPGWVGGEIEHHEAAGDEEEA